MKKQFFNLSIATGLTRDQCIQQLEKYHYKRVSMVIEQGTYTVKGYLIDVFPSNQNQPLRLDFFSGVLDEIHSFRVDTQSRLSKLKKTCLLPLDSHAIKQVSFDTQSLDSPLMRAIQHGDYIVHEQYGIGIYQGFSRLTVGHQEGEYILITFKGADKLYMPLDQIPYLHRYSGTHKKPTLNKLYDGTWDKIRRKSEKAISLIAENIYQMFKKRQHLKGFAFEPDNEEGLAFDLAFPYQETNNQKAAIQSVKSDMESITPMDRLICGDVGFGKTEVLMRAAMKAVLNLKQVMVLVPTTLLAEQHFQTFQTRFKGFGINITAISRLKTKAYIKSTLKGVKQHNYDIVIGTHRLLSKDVFFKDLGLVIVDEEQRFGVKHKETIKRITSSIDILTSSATPIPRTLYMSLTGAKHISMLNTPPKDRKPIHTVMSEYSPKLIRVAIQKEYSRGGQIYFLHNNIQDMEAMASLIISWFPNLRVRVAHGQLDPQKLEKLMIDFYQHKIDLLVCSSIIENGLDVQNANTIIINRADRLGLSQIHQIRGRVGRTNIQAYAYIMYPEHRELNKQAKGRLQALKEAVGLGVGYKLAMKDLEIRGGGTLLGEKQSGHLTAIGFDLYCKVLEKKLKQVRGEVGDASKKKHFISLKKTPYVWIPSNYIEDEKQRLAMYQSFLSVRNLHDLKICSNACIDRFGCFTKGMQNFVAVIQSQI